MRFEVYDENNKLFRRFWTRWEAARFLQEGWKLVEKAKFRQAQPDTATHGAALW